MSIRKILLGTAVVVLGLPLALTLIAIVTISVLDRTNGSIVTSGDTREYLLPVPNSYERAKPTPPATWPAQQRNLSRWNRLADANGFIVVYPSGTPQLLGVARVWHSFATGPGVERDVRFISELIDTLQSAYNIDPARIYANGMSNGGGMAFVLACTMSDRIAAVAMVAPAQSLPPRWCANTRPAQMMAFHGSADPIVPYDGGPLGDPFNPVKPVFAPVRDFVASWAERNQCTASPVDLTVASDVTRRE
jgi:polyhydroxybutyrate depolymerase